MILECNKYRVRILYNYKQKQLPPFVLIPLKKTKDNKESLEEKWTETEKACGTASW